MQIVRADSSHDAALMDFFSQQSIRGEMELRFVRDKSFFKKLDMFCQQHATYISQDDAGTIMATASIFFEQVYIHGQEKKICWLTDLRIGANKKQAYQWLKDLFAQVFQDARTQGAEHIFSAVFREDRESLRSLTRPRARHESLPQFLHMKNFDLVSLHGKLPGSRPFLSGLQIENLNTNRLEELSQFLNSHTERRLLGKCYSPEILAHRLENWEAFHRENFFVCYDKNRRLVGSFALWDIASFEKIQVIALTEHAQNFYQLTRWLSFLGLARPLPRPGDFLQFSYLTHLYCNNSDIFEEIIHFAYSQNSGKALIYPQFEDHFIQLPPKKFLHQNLSFGLYTILPQGQRPSEQLRQSPFEDPPDINIYAL